MFTKKTSQSRSFAVAAPLFVVILGEVQGMEGGHIHTPNVPKSNMGTVGEPQCAVSKSDSTIRMLIWPRMEARPQVNACATHHYPIAGLRNSR